MFLEDPMIIELDIHKATIAFSVKNDSFDDFKSVFDCNQIGDTGFTNKYYVYQDGKIVDVLFKPHPNDAVFRESGHWIVFGSGYKHHPKCKLEIKKPELYFLDKMLNLVEKEQYNLCVINTYIETHNSNELLIMCPSDTYILETFVRLGKVLYGDCIEHYQQLQMNNNNNYHEYFDFYEIDDIIKFIINDVMFLVHKNVTHDPKWIIDLFSSLIEILYKNYPNDYAIIDRHRDKLVLKKLML